MLIVVSLLALAKNFGRGGSRNARTGAPTDARAIYLPKMPLAAPKIELPLQPDPLFHPRGP